MRDMLRRLEWRTLLSHVVGIVCATGLIGAAWAFRDSGWETVREHPYFAIKEVKIRGVGELLERGALLRWLGVGDSLSSWDASPYGWRRRLESHPLVARAEVRREFPGRYEIAVRERRPQAIVLLDEPFYVDRAGNVFGPVGRHHSLDYPMITGVRDDMAPGYRRWLLRRGLRLVRLCDRIGCFEGVSEINLHPDLGPILYPPAPAVPIILGWGSWVEKLHRASRALQQWEGRESSLLSVDARFRDQVVVRLPESDPADASNALPGGGVPSPRDAGPQRSPDAIDRRQQPAKHPGMEV